MRYTRKLRQKIIDEFEAKHGKFNLSEFVKEVRLSNGTHPAYDFFEWDDGKCGELYRLQQAREFVQGLRVSYEVVVTEFNVGPVKVEAPAYISPLDDRQNGGGYHRFDPKIDMDEFRRQAAAALSQWARRYQIALITAGIAQPSIDELVSALEPEVLVAAE